MIRHGRRKNEVTNGMQNYRRPIPRRDGTRDRQRVLISRNRPIG